MGYTGSCAQLAPGDALFLYTDGVPEANNAALEEFTYERLAASLRDSMSLACREMIDRLTRERVGLHRRRPAIRRYHHALHPQGTVTRGSRKRSQAWRTEPGFSQRRTNYKSGHAKAFPYDKKPFRRNGSQT